MATPNGLNPYFGGRVVGGSFEAIHGKGVSTTVITLTGTTAVNLFGTTNGFRGTITGLLLSAIAGTGSTVTVKSGSSGATVATLTAGSATGAVSGINAVIANTAIDLNGTMTAVSSVAWDTSLLYITYKTDED